MACVTVCVVNHAAHPPLHVLPLSGKGMHARVRVTLIIKAAVRGPV